MRRTIVLGLVLAGGLSLTGCARKPARRARRAGESHGDRCAVGHGHCHRPTDRRAAGRPRQRPDGRAAGHQDRDHNGRAAIIDEDVEPPSTRAAAPPSSTNVASPSTTSSDDQIRTDAANAFEVVNTYWENLFATWKDPQGRPVYWQRPALYRVDGFYDSSLGEDFFCAGDQLGPQNASFCGSTATGTGTVEWDMDLFREQEGGHGNAPVYWTIAHEVGHAAQARFRHDNQGGAAPPMSDTVHTELQADCLSGATLAKAEQDGYLTDTSGTGVDEIIGFMSGMESGGDHGSSAARKHAFLHGHDTGDVESCLYNLGVPPPGLFQ